MHVYLTTVVVFYTVFKILGIDVGQQKWVNLTNVDRADRKNEIVEMCWNDDDNIEVIVHVLLVYLLY